MNSLKSRIWLAATALAILNCFCGLGAYLAASFFVTDLFITILVTFFVLAFTTMVFGWWLANEVLRPIESVTLLAKSLERSPTATLPRTTGSAETDELLRSLHRNSQQLQNLISMMDDVAAGKTEAATVPLENSDRLSASFQKLVSRVTDSITAKRELDALQNAVTRINSEISGVRGGKLEIDLKSDHYLTKDIADTLRYLTNRLAQIAKQVQMSSIGAASAASEARRSLRTVSETRDESSSKFSRCMAGIGDLPIKLNSVVTEVSAGFRSLESILSAAKEVSDVESNQTTKAGSLATHSAEAAKKIQRLRSRVNAIPQIGRTAQELARRSNLIALNTSIQGTDGMDSKGLPTLLVGEIGELSERAEELSKELQSTGNALVGEIADLANAFGAMTTDSTEVARGAMREHETSQEIQKSFTKLAAVQPELVALCAEQTTETESIVTIVADLTRDRSDYDLIRDTEQQLQRIVSLIENLRDSVSDLGTSTSFTSPASLSAKPSDSAFPFERITNNDQTDIPAGT